MRTVFISPHLLSSLRKKVKKSPKVIQLSSKRRLSSFNGIPLPDIDTGKRIEKEQSTAKFYVKETTANSMKQFYDENTEASSLPEYETWIEMGPEGEVVQRRRLAPLPKSHSDSALNENKSESEKESRIDSILNRTRNIFKSDKLKKSIDSLSGRLSNEESKPSWSPDPEDNSMNSNSGSKLRSITSSGLKAPLKGLQEKIKVKISERKMPQESDENANRQSSGAKVGFFSDIRNKFAMSPMMRKKTTTTTTTLTVEEVERRKRCKTTIIDL